MKEILMNVVIGMLTGLTSGIISGAWVAKYYRNKDHTAMLKKELADLYNLLKIILEDDDDMAMYILGYNNYNVFKDIEAKLTSEEKEIIENVQDIFDELKVNKTNFSPYRDRLKAQFIKLEHTMKQR